LRWPGAGRRSSRPEYHEENRGGVEAIDRGCRGDVESESPIRHVADHEQREDRPHSVVAESLPELGEEKRRQAFGWPPIAQVQLSYRLSLRLNSDPAFH